MHPQSRALSIGKYGCLAMCYLYCLGIEPDNQGNMIQYVSSAIDKGLLDDTCTVLDAEKYLFNFSGKRYSVTKKSINSIADIKNPAPVRFDFNGASHWVVVENGKIVFNSLLNSVCVAKGKPTTARIIELK